MGRSVRGDWQEQDKKRMSLLKGKERGKTRREKENKERKCYIKKKRGECVGGREEDKGVGVKRRCKERRNKWEQNTDTMREK